jgi:outer membrane receptor protein involved in Fe transport
LNNTGQLAAGLERYTANLLAHYDVNDGFRPFLEAKFVHLEAIQEGQPSFFQGGLLGSFRCNNPFLSADALAVLQSVGRCANPTTDRFPLSRFNVDFGGRGELQDRDTYRIVLGIDGSFNDDWRYEVALNYGRLETDLRSLNNLVLTDTDGNFDGYLLAYNAVRNGSGQIVCGVNADADPSNDRPDCVPLNLFGVGAPSRAALDFVNTTGRRKETAEEYVATAFISGDSSELFELPGGPAGFAIGSEYRIEKAESVWDELTASGATFLNAIPPFLPPDFKVAEVFAEIRLPILADLPYVHELTVDGAYRFSDYNTPTDKVSAYNVGLVYAPISDLRFRGNLSTSVRAPTQGDLYFPPTQNFAQVQDPCDTLYIGNNPNRAANCAAAGVPTGFVNTPARSASTSFQQSGYDQLVEEEGTSYTFGFVLMPKALPGFAFAVDYYNIEVEDLIATLGLQTTLNECYNSPGGIVGNPFCATISRDPDTSFFNDPAAITRGVNFAKQEAEGIDFDVSYQTTFDNGHRFAARLIATQLLTLDNYTIPTQPDYANRQMSELGDPELGFNVSVNYGVGPVDLNYSARYIGRQTIGFYEEQHSYDGRPAENADRFPRKWYPSVTYHNIRAEWELNDMVSVFGGVDNFTDEMPPLGLLGVAGGDPFDSIGAYFYGGVKVRL